MGKRAGARPPPLILTFPLTSTIFTCRLDAHVDDCLGRVRDGVPAKGDAGAARQWRERERGEKVERD